MNPSVDADWICLSADDYWNSNPHGRYHIAKEASRTHKVLWVNSIGHRLPSFSRKTGWLLVFRKLRSYAKYFRKPEPNFYVLTPITIPSFKSKLFQSVNRKMLWLQISICARIIGIRNPIYFVSSPSFGILHEKLRGSAVIYYYSDLYTTHREVIHKAETEYLDSKIREVSVLVYGASTEICRRIAEVDKRIRYLPHAVDLQHFQEAPKDPDPFSGIPRPIIGYYGQLNVGNDWDILKYCAQERPKYSFVFIGKKFIDLKEFEQRPNVYFFDKVPYMEIPRYGSHFDVAIMFWVLSEWIFHCSPLKLYEYLALGKPVVSVDIPEVRNKYNGIVLLAKSKNEFLEQIDRALNLDHEELRIAYNKIIKDLSWSKVLEKICYDLSQATK